MESKKRKRHLVNPYLISLLCVMALLSFPLCIWQTHYYLQTYKNSPDYLDVLSSVCILDGVLLAFWSIFFINGYQFFGTVEVIEDGLIFYAPFRKKRVFLYDELEEFGMDYSWTQGSKTHRLYFCKTPFDPKWRHNILRMSCTKDHMLMAYNETIYRELYDNAPPKVKKRMPMPWHEDSKLEKLYPQKEHVFYVTKAMMK